MAISLLSICYYAFLLSDVPRFCLFNSPFGSTHIASSAYQKWPTCNSLFVLQVQLSNKEIRPIWSLRVCGRHCVPQSSNHYLDPVEQFVNYSYPERNFDRNQLPDGSISLSPLYSTFRIDLHVRTPTALHQRFRWLQLSQAKFTVFRVLATILHSNLSENIKVGRLCSLAASNHITFIADIGFTHQNLRIVVRLLSSCFKTRFTFTFNDYPHDHEVHNGLASQYTSSNSRIPSRASTNAPSMTRLRLIICSPHSNSSYLNSSYNPATKVEGPFRAILQRIEMIIIEIRIEVQERDCQQSKLPGFNTQQAPTSTASSLNQLKSLLL